MARRLLPPFVNISDKEDKHIPTDTSNLSVVDSSFTKCFSFFLNEENFYHDVSSKIQYGNKVCFNFPTTQSHNLDNDLQLTQYLQFLLYSEAEMSFCCLRRCNLKEFKRQVSKGLKIWNQDS